MSPLFGFLLVWSIVVSAPVILVLLVGRQRLNRTVGCALLAVSFAAATSYKIWQFEWFDVWRHGTPGASLLIIYACYAAAVWPGRVVHRPVDSAQVEAQSLWMSPLELVAPGLLLS